MSYNKTANKYGMKNSTFSTKVMGICGRNIVRVEIEADGNVTERIPEFIYLIKMVYNWRRIMTQNYKINGIRSIIKIIFGTKM
jgi:hypothetical protein